MASLIDPAVFAQFEFEPLALLRFPLAAFKDAGAVFSTRTDDLDDYEFAVFQTDEGKVPFAILHYRQTSPMTVDLFVPRDRGLAGAPEPFIRLLAREFGIEPGYFAFHGASNDIGQPPSSPGLPLPIIHVLNSHVA